MRVLQIANRYRDYGGEDSSVDRIHRTLSDAGFECERCLFNSLSWSGPGAPSKFEIAARTFYNPASARTLADLQNRFRADLWLVHNVWPVGSPAVYQVAARLGIPVIQYLHNWRPVSVAGSYAKDGAPLAETFRPHYFREILSGSWQQSRVRTAVLAAAMFYARQAGRFGSVKAWVAISEFMRDRFIEAGFPASRVFALRHSWDLVNPTLDSPTPGEGYLFLGRLIEEKGIHVLLRAWRILESKLGARTPQLSIAGTGPLAKELMQLTHPWFRFHGSLAGTAKQEALRSCRAMLAPSTWWEPLGLVTYEAYDYGKPILAARSGGLTETVEHQKTGLLHQPGNAEELAGQILRIESSPSEALDMGKEGRRWLLANTSPEAWLEGFTSIARSVAVCNL